MIQKLFDTYVFLYVMGGLCAIGILIKLCLFLGYRSFIKASDSVSASKKRWMKQMKMKFETCYQLKIGVNNVDVFVDKYVSKRKFCGLLLSTWENISGQMITLCLLTASCAGILGIVYDCGKDIVLFTFFMGAVASILVITVDNLVNISAHKNILFLNLKDYFENYLKVRLEREHFYPEELNQYRREYFNPVSESKLEMASAKEANIIKPELRAPNIKVINTSSMVSEKEPIQNDGKVNETLNNKGSKRQEKKTAKLAKKEAKKAEKFARKEARESAKLIRKSEKIISRRSKKDDSLAKKVAKKESVLQMKLSKREAIEKEKQERINEKARVKQARIDEKKAKEDKLSQEKEEKIRSKQEKELSQQKAYQLKMRLKEEKELERKEMEQRKAEEALKKQEEEKLAKSNESLQETKVAETVNMNADDLKDLDKTAKNPNERQSEEDKLIEEVLREFLA